jgi:phosphatidylglycerophosphate synthase
MRSAVWAEIDARESGPVDPTTFVGGLPLVTRLVRQLSRLGYAGAQVVCADDDGQARIRRTLDRRPGPGSFPVEVVVGKGGAHRAAVTLDGRTLYQNDALAEVRDRGGAPPPLFTVRTRSDRREGLRRLLRALSKNIDREGRFGWYVARPLSRILARGFLSTTISPNQVTMLALTCGLVAAALLFRGGAIGAAIAGGLLILGVLLDNVDGDLARLRLQFSRLGEWLDSIGDEVVTLSVTAAIGLGLVRDGAPPGWRTVALATAAIGGAVIAKLYVDLARLGGAIDTAIYPWFFRADEVARAKGAVVPAATRRGLGGLLALGLDVVFRRDVYLTVVAALLIADRRKAALILLLAGVSGLAATYLLHTVVTTVRRVR